MPSDEKPGPNLVALRDAREQAIAQLSDAFAHNLIEVEEFERRVTLAHRSNSVADVERTVSDLVSPNPSVITVAATAPHPLLASERETDQVLAIFGGVERRGTWTLPRHLQAFAILGGIVLDFREALLLPGVTELQIVAVMGGVELIVPPGLSVEVSGTAVMGGFGHVERVPDAARSRSPRAARSWLCDDGRGRGRDALARGVRGRCAPAATPGSAGAGYPTRAETPAREVRAVSLLASPAHDATSN